MTANDGVGFHAPFFAVSWPTGEFGGMGLEGAVKLGYRNELAAIADPAERKARYDAMVAAMYEKGKALNAAALLELDDVIDPADTRTGIMAGLRSVPLQRPAPERRDRTSIPGRADPGRPGAPRRHVAAVSCESRGRTRAMREWRQKTWAVVLGVVLAGGAAVAAETTGHAGGVQPFTVGWQQYFDIRWGARPHDRGAVVDGYITNTWGMPARDVRVLVNAYDGSGAQTGQVIAWGPKEIDPGSRVYFDVTVPGGAATYDVSILSWEWFWSTSGGGM